MKKGQQPWNKNKLVSKTELTQEQHENEIYANSTYLANIKKILPFKCGKKIIKKCRLNFSIINIYAGNTKWTYI